MHIPHIIPGITGIFGTRGDKESLGACFLRTDNGKKHTPQKSVSKRMFSLLILFLHSRLGD